jgi:hypothetical protein
VQTTTKIMKKVFVISIFAIFLSNYSWAQEAAADADLAKQAQNPLANLVSIPFLNSTNFD